MKWNLKSMWAMAALPLCLTLAATNAMAQQTKPNIVFIMGDYGPAQGLPDSKVGTFTQALYDQAKKQGWTVISMKDDWKHIFAWEQ
jgi:hypothetical protein